MKRTRKDFVVDIASLGVQLVDAEKIVAEFINIIGDALQNNESVNIKNFGKFVVVRKPGGKFVNPKTKQVSEIPQHYKIKFIPSKNLKNFINESIIK